jgi:CheY-like chemotaxis protein
MKLNDASILVLDDELELCELCAEWLVAAGSKKVFTADNANDALAMLTSESINLMLSDVRMPGMDGLDLVRELAQIGKTLPTFFLSGFEGIDPREMYDLGVEALLRKPVEQELLLEVSKTALAERSSLWLTEMTIAPKQSVLIKARRLGKTSDTGTVCLGRGGFSTTTNEPLRLGNIAFQCCLGDQKLEMSGQGYVRWKSPDDDKVGIEFVYLEPACRSWVAEEIASSLPSSFIPGYCLPG